MNTARRYRGFTIIELLVVMAIIAILASGMLALFTSTQEKSRDTRRMEDVRELQKALSLYYIDNNQYPAAASTIDLTGSDSVSTTLVNAGTIPAIPRDPVTPTYEYTYQSASPGTYTITFCLETDRIPNYAEGCSNTVTP